MSATTTTTTPGLIAFHGDPKIKAKYLRRIRAHVKADELVRGGTGQGGKGCAVWCTLNKYDHASYETELGIPEVLAHLEDTIFEHLPVAEAMTWPQRFLSAIPVGADLGGVALSIVIWQYEDDVYGLRNTDEVKNSSELRCVCEDLITLCRRELYGQKIKADKWYALYQRAEAGAGAWAGAGAGAGAWAGARAWAGVGAMAWAEAWAGAGAEEKYYVALSAKLLELLSSPSPNSPVEFNP